MIVPVLPLSWSKGPDYWSFGVWPLVLRVQQVRLGGARCSARSRSPIPTTTAASARSCSSTGGSAPPRTRSTASPLFVSTRRPEKSFTWALPLNFYWRTGNDRSLLVLPLFYASWYPTGGTFATWLGYKHRNGPSHSGSLLWLYWGGGNDETKTAYDVLFPLLWSFRSKGGHSTVFFPFLWDFRSGASRTTVMFPFLAMEDGPSYFAAGFPFWWSGGNRAEGREFRAFLPVFFWKRDTKAKTAFLLTPVGGYSRDDTAGTKTWFALPFFLSHSDKESDTRVFSPLYISYRSKPEQSITRLVTLFYRREDPEGSTTSVFPLFWHFHDAPTDASATVLLPIFFRRSGPRDTTTFVGPVFWRSFTDGGWSGGLFPLAYFGANAERRHAVVFPLLWQYSNARAQSGTIAVAPLFYWHRDRARVQRGLPAAVLRRQQGRRQLGGAVPAPVPLRERPRRDQRRRSPRSATTAATVTAGAWASGPSFPSSSPARASSAPTSRCSRCSGTSAIATPIAAPRWPASTCTGAGATRPPTPSSRSSTTGAAHGRAPARRPASRCSLWSTTAGTRDTRVLVTPLGGATRGPNRAAGFLGPYFWYEDKAIAVRFIPLLHADITNRVTGERTRQYGPWFQTDAPDHWSRAFFPVFGVYQDNRERDTWVFPTFFRMRRKDGDRIDAFLPLYWRSSLGGQGARPSSASTTTAPRPGSTTTVSSRSSSTPATRSGR